LKNNFPDHQFLIVWDGKSARRVAEAKEGVKKGLVPSGYKENRARGDDLPQELKDFYSQSAFLQKGIGQTGIPQIRIQEFEADDVIASYARILKEHNDVTVVTSDRDFWQMLDNTVSLWDGMKEQTTTKASWEEQYGLEAIKAIDIGALTGDSGDNIFGIPGWGEKTALKELKKHGTWKAVYADLHAQYDKLRKQFPDLHTKRAKEEGVRGEEFFKELAKKKSDPDKKTSRFKYPEIYWGMPFSGVLWAFDKGSVKMPKSAIMALVFEERVKLAYSLKKMDDDIPGLPSIESNDCDKNKIVEYFEYYDIYSLHDDIKVFTGNVDSDDVEAVEVQEEEDILAC
jgi:5'-3' exonuclease